MNVLVVPDSRYYMLPNGKVYVESVFTYDFFKRYLMVFDEVLVAARIEHIAELYENMQESSGKGVSFIEIPNYRGPWQHIIHYPQLIKSVKKGIGMSDCAIFRVPAATANTFQRYYHRSKKAYAIEVVVDPEKYFEKGTMKGILRPIIQKVWTRQLKKMCLQANGVSYVTTEYLQQHYPCKAVLEGETQQYFTASYSSVLLPSQVFSKPRIYKEKDMWTLVHVSNSISGYRKGHLTVLKTISELRKRGYNVRVRFIGDGALVREFMEIAKEMGISDEVTFVGRLANRWDVIHELRNADIMVFPTMAEGLPRVLLEGMATGLPCISSPVCGIPEILDEEYLVNYDDYLSYANKVEELISNTGKMQSVSARNIKKAWEYEETKLNLRREEFYRKLSILG